MQPRKQDVKFTYSISCTINYVYAHQKEKEPCLCITSTNEVGSIERRRLL